MECTGDIRSAVRTIARTAVGVAAAATVATLATGWMTAGTPLTWTVRGPR
jgi:hypothetical protein